MKKPTKLTTALLLAMAVNSSYASERCFPPVGEIPTLPEVLECFQNTVDKQQQLIEKLTAENKTQQDEIQALKLRWDLKDGLVAHYPFDGDANDVSGHGHHGSVKGATLTVDRLGNPNRAYHFDGGDSYIEIHDNPLLALSGNFTVSAWVKKNGNWVQTHPMIIAKNPINAAYILWVNHDHQEMENADFSIRVNISGSIYTSRSSVIPETGNWYQVTGVRRDSRLEIYVDGNLQNVETVPNSPVSITEGSLTISDYLSTSDSFNGVIEDVRIYNRALTALEIKALYKQPQVVLNQEE